MVTPLREGVWQLSLRGVNAYLVDDGSEVVLIDAGTPLDGKRIRSKLGDTGFDLPDIDSVLITHYDIDHVGALAQLASDIHAPVYVRSPDAEYLTRERRPSFTNRKGAFQRLMDLVMSVPEIDLHHIEDGDSIGSFTAYATPGHTPGHTVYISETLGVACLGDLVTGSNRRLKPAPRILTQDPAQNIDSIIDLVERSPAFEVAAIGHGTPIWDRGSEILQHTARRLQE